MAESDVQQLVEAAAQDADLKLALVAATSPADAVRIANEKGIAVTLEDLTLKAGQLSEAELEGVSGGTGDFTGLGICYWFGTA